MYDYLRGMGAPVPDWLAKFELGRRFEAEAFFTSRIVFYPGSGVDGQPVKLFGGTHAAHCFVYADFGLSRAQIEKALHDPRSGFRGYSQFATIDVTADQLTRGSWRPHVSSSEVPSDGRLGSRSIDPWGMLLIAERNETLDDEHGPRRLAILFLGADGVASFDALFCQPQSAGVFGVVIQDHSCGGNYTQFGRGGLMEKIAERTGKFPDLQLCAENSAPWDGYGLVPTDPAAVPGGMHAHLRRLYRRESADAK